MAIKMKQTVGTIKFPIGTSIDGVTIELEFDSLEELRAYKTEQREDFEQMKSMLKDLSPSGSPVKLVREEIKNEIKLDTPSPTAETLPRGFRLIANEDDEEDLFDEDEEDEDEEDEEDEEISIPTSSVESVPIPRGLRLIPQDQVRLSPVRNSSIEPVEEMSEMTRVLYSQLFTEGEIKDEYDK